VFLPPSENPVYSPDGCSYAGHLHPDWWYYVKTLFRHADTMGYLSLGFSTVFGSVIGRWLSLYIVQHFGATDVSIAAYLVPIVTAIAGGIFLDERIISVMVASMSMIAGGLIINQRRWPAGRPSFN
jgi:drug/metabolite transporter (DMT)-like permease